MYGPTEYVKGLLGERAVRVPAWYYLRNHGDGVVSFAGASRVPDNPLLYGSERDVRFGNGELIIRPAVLVGTDIFHGYTMGQLMTEHHDVDNMLREGEHILPPPGGVNV